MGFMDDLKKTVVGQRAKPAVAPNRIDDEKTDNKPRHRRPMAIDCADGFTADAISISTGFRQFALGQLQPCRRRGDETCCVLL